MLILEGLVSLHRTIQLQLLQHYWLGHRLGLLWYWMVCFGNEQRSFCVFEIAPKYCISVSFVEKIRDTKGRFHAKMGRVKYWNGMNLTEAEDIRRGGKNTRKKYIKKILMTQMTMISRGSFWSRDWTHVSYVSCIGRCFFTTSTCWEVCSICEKSFQKSYYLWNERLKELASGKCIHKLWNILVTVA